MVMGGLIAVKTLMVGEHSILTHSFNKYLLRISSLSSFWFSSVTQSCPTLCDPTDCSTPGFPVHYQLPEFKLMSIESVMPFNHLILCCSLLLPSSIFTTIRNFSKESAFCIRWPKYWSFSFSISPSKRVFKVDFFSRLTGLISLLFQELSRVFSSITIEKYQVFCTLPS